MNGGSPGIVPRTRLQDGGEMGVLAKPAHGGVFLDEVGSLFSVRVADMKETADSHPGKEVNASTPAPHVGVEQFVCSQPMRVGSSAGGVGVQGQIPTPLHQDRHADPPEREDVRAPSDPCGQSAGEAHLSQYLPEQTGEDTLQESEEHVHHLFGGSVHRGVFRQHQCATMVGEHMDHWRLFIVAPTLFFMLSVEIWKAVPVGAGKDHHPVLV